MCLNINMSAATDADFAEWDAERKALRRIEELDRQWSTLDTEMHRMQQRCRTIELQLQKHHLALADMEIRQREDWDRLQAKIDSRCGAIEEYLTRDSSSESDKEEQVVGVEMAEPAESEMRDSEPMGLETRPSGPIFQQEPVPEPLPHQPMTPEPMMVDLMASQQDGSDGPLVPTHGLSDTRMTPPRTSGSGPTLSEADEEQEPGSQQPVLLVIPPTPQTLQRSHPPEPTSLSPPPPVPSALQPSHSCLTVEVPEPARSPSPQRRSRSRQPSPNPTRRSPRLNTPAPECSSNSSPRVNTPAPMDIDKPM